MMNPSRTNEESNHRNAYSGNSPSPPESSVLKHQSGIAMDWTSEEQVILDNGLVRYSSEPIVLRYAKIALDLPNKTVRDVAMRCRWKYKENNKRRKEDHNGSGRARVDNKEVIDMVVASNSVPYLFAPSLLLREQHGITNELLKQNEQLFNEISSNLTSLRLNENFTHFSKIRENIRKLLKNLNENVPEAMKHMLPLPEKLSDELADSILLTSNFPKFL